MGDIKAFWKQLKAAFKNAPVIPFVFKCKMDGNWFGNALYG